MFYGYYWTPFLQIWRIIKPFACWNNDKFKLHTMSIACVIMVMGYCKILICMRILLMIFKVALRTYCYFYTYSNHLWTASKNSHNSKILIIYICIYLRSDSPATVAQRRRSSTQNINQYGISSRRSASLTPNTAAKTLANDGGNTSGSNSSTPRGSLSNINSIRGRSASINSTNLKHQNTPALKTAILNHSRFSSTNENFAGGNTTTNIPTSNRRSPYSPLISRRQTAPIPESVSDTSRFHEHKQVNIIKAI